MILYFYAKAYGLDRLTYRFCSMWPEPHANRFMLSGRIILLVDDDLDDQEFFIEAMQRIDPTVVCVTANDGVEALLKLNGKEVCPDIIFLDVNMHRMDGRRCLAELKKSDHLSHIPVIVLSTFIHKTEAENFKKLGAVDILTKSSSFNIFMSILKTALANVV